MQTISLEQYVAEIDKEEARMEGEMKGRMEGRMEGEMKGMEKGEEKKAFDVARTMLADGLPAETIRKYTGLDESFILSLR